MTEMKPSKVQRVYAVRMRPRVRWSLFSLFLLGAGVALWVDASAARDRFWLVLVPLISGGGLAWIFCFGREPTRRNQDSDENKTGT